MCEDFHFTEQPREDHFKTFSAIGTAKKPLKSRSETVTKKAVAKATKYAQSHPEEAVAIKLSSARNMVVPFRPGMTLLEVFHMDDLVRYGEIIFLMGEIFGEDNPNKKAKFSDPSFNKAVLQIGRAAPSAAIRFYNSIAQNDFNGIQGSLIELHISALNLMEDLYMIGPRIETIAYQHAAKPLLDDTRMPPNDPAVNLGL